MNVYATSKEDLEDMQALIRSGFGELKLSEYLLLEVSSGQKARTWLRHALKFVRSADPGSRRHGQGALASDRRKHEAWSIAFTHHGLENLGIVQEADAPFPSEFRTGQANDTRRKLLREDLSVAWKWGDVQVNPPPALPDPVSILVSRLHDGNRRRPNLLLTTKRLAAYGLEVVRRVHGPDSFVTDPMTQWIYVIEPFGFRDGIAQPDIQGLPHSPNVAEAKCVPLGEFVLGHPNAYGEISHCPEVKPTPASQGHSFGRNGCYLAVQQIHQNVAAFRTFDRHHPGSGSGPTVAEKMIGRRKDGRPLQEAPRPPASENAFGFRMNDPRGLQCPIGSHIRRANPRDSLPDSDELGKMASNLHRLLRRGRPFRSSGVADDCVQRPPQEVGLFFIAIVADLARQFEFVKRVWIGNPCFGDLCDEGDPILGRRTSRRFTLPSEPTGTQVGWLPDFTTTLGGGYFFMPGLGTLKRIAQGDYSTTPGIQPKGSVPIRPTAACEG